MSVLFFARDPGAANILVSLYKSLDEESVFFAKDFAYTHVKRFGTAVRSFNDEVYSRDSSPADAAEIRSWLSSFAELAAVVTGTTSQTDDTDRLIWKECAALGIPSIAVIDLAICLPERFHDRANEIYHPDYILSPDEACSNSLRADHFARKEVVTIGRPYLAELHANRHTWLAKRESTREHIRELFSCDFDTLSIFASEAQRTPYDSETSCEQKAFDAAKAIAPPNSTLVVKLHPREQPQSYKDIHPYTIQDEIDSLSLIAAADIVFGIKSILLLESILFERPTVAITEWDAESQNFLPIKENLCTIVSDTREQDLIDDIGKIYLADRESLASKIFIVDNWKDVFLDTLNKARQKAA